MKPTEYTNLADERLGTEVLSATDDFFAEKENLIKAGRGIFIDDKYTDRGKWMDGWESRRKRTPGHDSCIIRLGAEGVIRGVDIDTNHFLGNHPPHASIEACRSDGEPGDDATWVEILAKSPLEPGSQNIFECGNDQAFNHVKLHIYPDGGVARLRVYGEVKVDWESKKNSGTLDLLSVLNGGRVLKANDMFFSSKDNLIMPGRGVNMGDGWETKRRREPGNDWIVAELGHRGKIQRIEVDTAHFKGNFPDSCSILSVDLGDQKWDSLNESEIEKLNWTEILPQQKLQADHQHYFESEINRGPITSHLQFNIFPDGGISRLRAWGEMA